MVMNPPRNGFLYGSPYVDHLRLIWSKQNVHSERIVFCLSTSPNKEAISEAHKEAHGLVPQEIFEVQEGS